MRDVLGFRSAGHIIMPTNFYVMWDTALKYENLSKLFELGC